ncbi:MAG: hypothetical protein LAT57_07805 [Balneolales bacterium]|nr:hypothetical protein [Balneolales bacterium]
MYIFKPDNIWCTAYRIEKDLGFCGTIKHNMWSSIYSIVIDNEEVIIKKRKWYSNDKIMLQNGVQVGKATFKTFKFRPTIQVEYKDRLFELKSQGGWGCTFDLFLSGSEKPIGSIKRSGIFTKSYETSLPDQVELWFQAVLVGLLISLASQQAAAVGAG